MLLKPSTTGCSDLNSPESSDWTRLAQDVHDRFPQGQLSSYSVDELPHAIESAWTGIIVAQPHQLRPSQIQTLFALRSQGCLIIDIPTFYEAFYQKLPSQYIERSSFIIHHAFKLMASRWIQRFKRVIDLAVSIALLIATLPLMGLTAVLIKLESPGSVLYSQLRTGFNGSQFRVYKFRSMRKDAETAGAQWAQAHDPRVTRIGHWLRRLRIDELPQLWNVLRGDMSLIGPRPERPEFDATLAQAIPHYTVRYQVKPGITGWAQVNYPYGASVEDAAAKLAYDLYYIKHYSIGLDMAIALRTLFVIVLGKGR